MIGARSHAAQVPRLPNWASYVVKQEEGYLSKPPVAGATQVGEYANLGHPAERYGDGLTGLLARS